MAYKIKSGDTLSEIAQKNNTSVAEIMASNPQISNANQIQAGASLNLGSSGSGQSTYAGNYGTSSGGNTQEQARTVVGDTRAAELAKIKSPTGSGAAAQEARKYGYVGGIESLDQANLQTMSESKFDAFSGKNMVIGGLLGAVIPGAGLLYGVANTLGASQDRKVATQLMEQGDYENKGLFGTGLFKGEDAAQYVPVYNENDELVGSLGLDAEGQPLRYAGDRMADYDGLGSDLIQPAEAPNFPDDDNDRPSPVSAEAVGVNPDVQPPGQTTSGFAQVPTVQLPSALDQPQITPRPVSQALTRPTQLPPNFGQQTGVMGTEAALRNQEMYPFMYGNQYQKPRPQQNGFA